MKTDWPSIEWCSKVSPSVEMPPEEVKTLVRKWYHNGKSVEEIKSLLVQIAQARNHKLVFVGTHGTN